MLLKVAAIKNEFLRRCETASKDGALCCNFRIAVGQSLASRRGFTCEIMKEKLHEHLADLGSALCISHSLQPQGHVVFFLSASWDPDALTDDAPQVTGGTCASCPICYQHRPAVALVPCGHVVCRDCHRSNRHRLQQCPMCRGVTTAVTRGLYMDQWLLPCSMVSRSRRRRKTWGKYSVWSKLHVRPLLHDLICRTSFEPHSLQNYLKKCQREFMLILECLQMIWLWERAYWSASDLASCKYNFRLRQGLDARVVASPSFPIKTQKWLDSLCEWRQSSIEEKLIPQVGLEVWLKIG